MGLDIFFYKRKFSKHNPNEPIGKNEKCKDIYEDMGDEIAYFRKVNFLMSYFGYLEGEKDNCYYKEIKKTEIEQLIEDCTEVLNNKSKIINGKNINIPLHPIDGFFFGNTEFNEYFFIDVEEVKDIFSEILNNLNEDEQIFMYAWW